MSKIIALIRLSHGQVAFYDDLTGIHLTIGNPTAEITDSMNTFKIRRAIANRVLTLVQGSFNIENKNVEPEPIQEAVKIKEIKKPEIKNETTESEIVCAQEIKTPELETKLESETESEKETKTKAKTKTKRKKKEDKE